MEHRLTPAIAACFARIALGHVRNEYPHKLDHVLSAAQDARAPSDLHPVFYGSFDWHSCVHGYWLLLTIRRLFPDLEESAGITSLANEMLTPDKLGVELAYLSRPYSAGFERPYGWAWLLALHREAARHRGTGWAKALAPLACAFAERFRAYLPKLTYPIRTGTHFNTAFALILALEWAEAMDADLAALIRTRANDYFGSDRDCPAWEPGGDEFLSSALVEALCMRRTLPQAGFRSWFEAYLPRLRQAEPKTLFTPAFVSDRSDGKIAHLDGFNLSRAWCWRALGRPELAENHLEASLPHVAGDYMGEHWLATFALLALLAEPEAE
jgi:Protein of unknown function (DUF2891)